jgi:hypothetical protein
MNNKQRTAPRSELDTCELDLVEDVTEDTVTREPEDTVLRVSCLMFSVLHSNRDFGVRGD